MDNRIFEIIACPVCNGRLYQSHDRKELICDTDKLAFPFLNEIPVLLESEARSLISTSEEKKSCTLLS